MNTDSDENVIVFEPVPSTVPFFTGAKFIELICGPVGSTKTTAGLMKIAYEAKRVAPCRDGIRRSRCVVVRNTRQMLDDTTIPDFLKWFPEGQAGVYHRTGSKYVLRFDDVECEVLFRGLDEANDVRRLLSLQLTFGVMDEFREIHQDIFESLQARVGRYPDKSMNGVGCKDEDGNPVDKVWGMTNPPDMDSFWEEFMSNPPANAEVHIQPSGLSPEADWTHHLKDDYYANLAEGKAENWVNVYIHAKFGESLAGKPVFPAFNRAQHTSQTPLKPVFSFDQPLIIGVDAGLSPAAVIGQVAYDGRLFIYNALISEGMGALRFIREKLKPLLANKFAGYKSVVIIDPAAFQRSQTDERTVASIYRQEGFVVKAAKTNKIAARLASVDNYLTRTVDGKPLFVIDGEGAAPLVQAMAGKYRYKVKRTGEVDETPEKSHPWSDVADALEYLCLHADQGGIFGGEVVRDALKVSAVSAAGWT